jgi:hypothetical protein
VVEPANFRGDAEDSRPRTFALLRAHGQTQLDSEFNLGMREFSDKVDFCAHVYRMCHGTPCKEATVMHHTNEATRKLRFGTEL